MKKPKRKLLWRIVWKDFRLIELIKKNLRAYDRLEIVNITNIISINISNIDTNGHYYKQILNKKTKKGTKKRERDKKTRKGQILEQNQKHLLHPTRI